MRISTVIGGLFLGGCGAVIALVTAGAAEPVTLVALAPLGIGATVALVLRRISAGMERQGDRVRELEVRGIRRRGLVRDVVPFGAYHGGAVLHEEGVLMILRVALEADPGAPARTVSVHVVEPTEVARARIGTAVVVLEHPEEPGMLALEGHQPGGRRLLVTGDSAPDR
jgi:hypothetical protein